MSHDTRIKQFATLIFINNTAIPLFNAATDYSFLQQAHNSTFTGWISVVLSRSAIWRTYRAALRIKMLSAFQLTYKFIYTHKYEFCIIYRETDARTSLLTIIYCFGGLCGNYYVVVVWRIIAFSGTSGRKEGCNIDLKAGF